MTAPVEGLGTRALSLQETLALITPGEAPADAVPRSVDVVIVGAGPVGLTTANLLGSYGVDCLLVEQNPALSSTPKAIAVDDEYMRVLDRVGLVSALAPHLSRPFGVHFMSPLGFALVKVPGFITPNGFGNRNAVLQPVFETILLEGSRRYPSVRMRFGTAVTSIVQDPAQLRLGLETEGGPCEIAARYMLACDGARSFVRTALDIPFPGTRIDEPHLVVDLAEFPDQVDYSRFFCNPVRPVNSVPAPYGGRRLEFMLSPHDEHERVLTDEGIRELVDRHTPYRGVKLNIVRRAIYGFSERIAGQLQSGRVFLLGDAAHVMPPFGGQGMNTGARDAANLCWKVAAVLRGEASPEALASYEAERRDHIRATVRYSVRVGRLANIRSRGLAGLRDAGFALANLLPSVRRYFREMRHLPRPFLTAGLLATNQAGDDGLTGRILPRLPLRRPGAGELSLDEAAGPWFALIGMDVGADVLAAAADHTLWRSLQPALVTLTAGLAGDQDGGAALAVADGRGRDLLARHRGTILVLRPDRYVAGRAAPEEFSGLSDRLAHRLVPHCEIPQRHSHQRNSRAEDTP